MVHHLDFSSKINKSVPKISWAIKILLALMLYGQLPTLRGVHVTGFMCQSYIQNTYRFYQSAYEVKNNCCLFERFFKVKKNGVFLFGIYFFVIEISTFLHYAN